MAIRLADEATIAVGQSIQVELLTMRQLALAPAVSTHFVYAVLTHHLQCQHSFVKLLVRRRHAANFFHGPPSTSELGTGAISVLGDSFVNV
jgi:hypothetical protein